MDNCDWRILSIIFKSITSDNGSEFAKLSQVFPNSQVFYAHPNSAFERGTNEKQNSLVRRFIPKGKSMENLSSEKVSFVEDWINNLPRKILNYSTTKEIFCSFVENI